MKWFDRKFDFTLPPWMFANVVERLRGTPARVEDLVSGAAIELLTSRSGGQWSIQENVGHLLDLEPLWIGRVEDILRGSERLREADLTNRKTHEAGHNEASMGAMLQSFRELRRQLVARLDQLDEDSIERSALHPRLEQPMRMIDLAFFVAEHDDHHLAQITRLKKSGLSP